MLLHVVEAAGPIHLARRAVTGQGLGQEVCHPVAFIHYIGNRDPAQPPGIERLPSGGGIKSGAVEVNPPAFFTSLDNGGLKVAQVGIGIIESLGHEEPGASRRVQSAGT
jgi:hypothetical protein